MMKRSDDFDELEETGEGLGAQAPTHIWLRYATQFTSGERSYTIDVGIPVPLGADAATREQLLREADAGLDQLANYVERRVMQVAQQSGTPSRPSSPSRPASPPIPAPTPAAAPTPISLPVSTPSVQSAATGAGATGSPSRAQTPAAPTPAPQAAPAKQATTPPTPPSRPNIGASMPSSPSLPAGTLSLPEFLKYLKDMGLDARRAMTLLKVKSLSGLNLREALEQLQHILMQEDGNSAAPNSQAGARTPTGPQASTQSQPPSSRPTPETAESHPASNPANPSGSQAKSGTSKPVASAPQTPPTRSTPAPASTSASNHQARSGTSEAASPSAPTARPSSSPDPVVHPAPTHSGVANGAKQTTGEPRPLVLEEKAPYPLPVVVFDEEEDEDELEDLDFNEDENEGQEASFGTAVGLSAANRGSAEDLVSKLREAGGTSPVSALRLKALHNVIAGQLTPEQIQALVRGVWGVASEKKLKGEQAEALISWGKQDAFVAEAEMLLAYFEENGNASSNR